jgi:hypothetical protein
MAQRFHAAKFNREMRAAQRKAEADLKREIDHANREYAREVDRVNRENQRRVNAYNRKVDQHNGRVIADYNRDVERVNQHNAGVVATSTVAWRLLRPDRTTRSPSSRIACGMRSLSATIASWISS